MLRQMWRERRSARIDQAALQERASGGGRYGKRSTACEKFLQQATTGQVYLWHLFGSGICLAVSVTLFINGQSEQD